MVYFSWSAQVDSNQFTILALILKISNQEILQTFMHFHVSVKAPINFVISFPLSVSPYMSKRLPLEGFRWNLILKFSRKSVEKINIRFKSAKISGTSHEYVLLMSETLAAVVTQINKYANKYLCKTCST
jgi:hypothetical protein